MDFRKLSSTLDSSDTFSCDASDSFPLIAPLDLSDNFVLEALIEIDVSIFDSCDIFSLNPSLGSTDGFLLSFGPDEEVSLAAEVWSPDCIKLVLDVG